MASLKPEEHDGDNYEENDLGNTVPGGMLRSSSISTSTRGDVLPGKISYTRMELLSERIGAKPVGRTHISEPDDSEHKGTLRTTSKRDDEEDGEQSVRNQGPAPANTYTCYNCELGSGAYKTVYKGIKAEQGVEVAWNELKTRKLSKAERRRFEDEVDILKSVNHPNVVRFYDYWVDGVNIIFITELMTSGTLKQYLRKTNVPKTKILQSWCKQILNGVNYLHLKKIIHRDLKCDNIFIDGTKGEVKIGDLGLAISIQKTSFASSVIGTPEFVAPEMYQEKYSFEVDIWAFGLMVLEMVTLAYPYTECTGPAQIFSKVTKGVLPAVLSTLDGGKTRVNRDFILGCLTLNPAERATIKDLLRHEFFTQVDDTNVSFDKEMTTINLETIDLKSRTILIFLKKVIATPEDHHDHDDTHEKQLKTKMIEFTMSFDEDPEKIVTSMIEEGLIAPADKEELSLRIEKLNIKEAIRNAESARRDTTSHSSTNTSDNEDDDETVSTNCGSTRPGTTTTSPTKSPAMTSHPTTPDANISPPPPASTYHGTKHSLHRRSSPDDASGSHGHHGKSVPGGIATGAKDGGKIVPQEPLLNDGGRFLSAPKVHSYPITMEELLHRHTMSGSSTPDQTTPNGGTLDLKYHRGDSTNESVEIDRSNPPLTSSQGNGVYRTHAEKGTLGEKGIPGFIHSASGFIGLNPQQWAVRPPTTLGSAEEFSVQLAVRDAQIEKVYSLLQLAQADFQNLQAYVKKLELQHERMQQLFGSGAVLSESGHRKQLLEYLKLQEDHIFSSMEDMAADARPAVDDLKRDHLSAMSTLDSECTELLYRYQQNEKTLWECHSKFCKDLNDAIKSKQQLHESQLAEAAWKNFSLELGTSGTKPPAIPMIWPATATSIKPSAKPASLNQLKPRQ